MASRATLTGAACAILAVLGAAVLPSGTIAQPTGEHSVYPAIHGAAEAPRMVTSGSRFSYKIWVKDRDSVFSSAGLSEYGDKPELRLEVVQSMEPGFSIQGGPEYDGGGSPTGYAEWIISGTAKTVTEETDFADSFSVGDSGKVNPQDGGIELTQRVEVVP